MQTIEERERPLSEPLAERATATPWVVVLAGRPREPRQRSWARWLAWRRPPQYRTFVGSRSMIRHTVDRARRLAPDDRVVTVIDREDRTAFELAAGKAYPGVVLFQRRHRGTAPELLLALTFVLAEDPAAVVAVLPADQFVFPDGRFLCAVARALDLAATAGSPIVLLGQVPDGPEAAYSWIELGTPCPGRSPGPSDRQPVTVRRLHDSPSELHAASLHRRGALLNTKVLAARGSALWDLAAAQMPAVLQPFEALRTQLLGGPRIDAGGSWRASAEIDACSPDVDLYRDLLSRSRNAVVVRMDYVQWSDWALARRVRPTLDRFGRYPSPPRMVA